MAFLFFAGPTYAVPALSLNLWTCDIPCETKSDEPPGVLLSAHFAWCAKSVLSPEMIERMTPMCKKANQTDNARAVRYAAASMGRANCTTSGNGCKEEGPVHVGYNCKMRCPGEDFTRRFSVCAVDTQEAWSAAQNLCNNPIPPPQIPLGQICTPDGQTPCDP